MRVALLVLVLSASTAWAAPSPIESGTPYLQARRTLEAKGWSGGPTPMDSKRCGIGWEDICNGPDTKSEVMTCRGTGKAGCTFVFSKDRDGPALLVETQGEELAEQRVVGTKLISVDKLMNIYAKHGW